MSRSRFSDDFSRSRFRNRFAVGDIPQYKVGPQLFNYYGNGEDGDLVVNSNLSFPSVQDGDMIVKQYKSLTINSGTVTTSNRCRGLMIYVDGDCTINGTLSMTARGCKANPNVGTTDEYTPVAPSDGNPVDSNGLRIPMKTYDGTDTLIAANFNGCGNAAVAAVANHRSIDGDGTIFRVEKMGTSSGTRIGLNMCGGGGHTSGNGANATCFGGGGGGGGSVYSNERPGGHAIAYGGKGGNGGIYSNIDGGCGAGNPGGQNNRYIGGNGTGGLLILIIRGNLTIGPTGIINSEGKNGTDAYYDSVGGSGSGGGVIKLLYSGVLSNQGNINANGGIGGRSRYKFNMIGRVNSGGNGDIQTAQIV